MAKTPNGLGQFSGKLGGVVFAITNGQQTVRQYQPVVANPKSSAQLLQRAKGNLVGRLSSITPRDAIVGLGVNNRDRRSRFLKLMLQRTTASFVGGDAVAKLPFSDLLFSEGSQQLLLRAFTASISGFQVSLSFTRESVVSQSMWSRLGCRCVVVGLNSVTSSYDFMQVADFNMPSDVPSADTPVALNMSLHLTAGQAANYSFAAYFCQYLLDSNKRSSLASFLGFDVTDVVANLSLSKAASSLLWANSYYTPVVGSAASTSVADADVRSAKSGAKKSEE